MPARRGVTLLELMVVVVLIGIMTTIAAVSPIRAGPADVRSTTVARCREAAAQTGRAVAVAVDTVRLLCLADGQIVGARSGQFVGEYP